MKRREFIGLVEQQRDIMCAHGVSREHDKAISATMQGSVRAEGGNSCSSHVVPS